jgi:protein-disulfide isomerase
VILGVGIVVAALLAITITRGGEQEQAAAPGAGTTTLADARHVKGRADAAVTLVEFGDFQCPTCGSFYPVVKRLSEQFPTDLKVEFFHFPLIGIHPNAMSSAIAAEAAGEQGRFWEMHDMLFENQQAWSPLANPRETFLMYAGAIGLDLEQFEQDMRSDEIINRVVADGALASQRNLPGTPTFILNGRQIGLPLTYVEFERLIYEAIEQGNGD